MELDPTDLYEYEVLIFDQQRGRELVAAIEIVSPANKDRQKLASICFEVRRVTAKENLRLDR